MFSPITIPSSTKIPITIIIPNNDKTLIVIPSIGAKTNIPKKEIGSPAATQKASFGFKNNDRKNKTNNTPINPFSANNLVR